MTSLQNLSIRSLLRKLRPRTSRYCVPMHSVEGMRYLVQRERYRADRGGPSFSLLAIRILNNDPEDREVEAMIRWLQLHVRITDDVGELLDGRVGLLLPDTSGAGAAAVADRVRLECDCRDLSCDIEILDYPRTPSPESAEADANGGGVRSQQPVEQTTLMRSLFVRTHACLEAVDRYSWSWFVVGADVTDSARYRCGDQADLTRARFLRAAPQRFGGATLSDRQVSNHASRCRAGTGPPTLAERTGRSRFQDEGGSSRHDDRSLPAEDKLG